MQPTQKAALLISGVMRQLIKKFSEVGWRTLEFTR